MERIVYKAFELAANCKAWEWYSNSWHRGQVYKEFGESLWEWLDSIVAVIQGSTDGKVNFTAAKVEIKKFNWVDLKDFIKLVESTENEDYKPFLVDLQILLYSTVNKLKQK